MKSKGNKIITAVFYSVYFLLIVGFAVSMYFFRSWLTEQLISYEAATQPTVRSEEVFQTLFAAPDWGQLYEDSGMSDTAFEGKDTFVAYMEATVGEKALTYTETESPDSVHTYLIRLDNETLGSFTLADQAEPDDLIPDWELDSFRIDIPRTQSVTVIKQDGHIVCVNGQALGDGYTVEILSTVAERYLPEGTAGIRRLRQEVTGLLVAPQVTVLDENGNECAVFLDEETGMYVEEIPEAEPITDELEDRAIAAGEAYCYYMVNRNIHLLGEYFLSGSAAHRSITGSDRWLQESTDARITGHTVSEYTRYTDDLFSARVTMTVKATRADESTKRYSLDSTLFFENRKAGWMVIAMTDGNVTEETSQVRLTFMNGDTQLSTAFYASDEAEIFAPALSVPEGQVFSGWAEKMVADDGTVILNPVFACDEDNRLIIPDGTPLKPMTLYALYEDLEETVSVTGTTESEETQ